MDYRGILKDVVLDNDGRAHATLASIDLNAGEEGRNTLLEDEVIKTSGVTGFDVIDGQLVMATENSNYLIEGEVLMGEGHE
jgi:hypothetical protein